MIPSRHPTTPQGLTVLTLSWHPFSPSYPPSPLLSTLPMTSSSSCLCLSLLESIGSLQEFDHCHDAFLRTRDFAEYELTLLSSVCGNYAELSGRSRISVLDVLSSSEDLGVNLEELDEYCISEGKGLGGIDDLFDRSIPSTPRCDISRSRSVPSTPTTLKLKEPPSSIPQHITSNTVSDYVTQVNYSDHRPFLPCLTVNAGTAYTREGAKGSHKKSMSSSAPSHTDKPVFLPKSRASDLTLLARTTRLAHPPVLQRGNQKLYYGTGVNSTQKERRTCVWSDFPCGTAKGKIVVWNFLPNAIDSPTWNDDKSTSEVCYFGNPRSYTCYILLDCKSDPNNPQLASLAKIF
ncbi:hypothetical protein BDR06DRAFT_1021352 [Suillus hirtellus]|nr:hypothetical protein BDR06DRAFT_1021352 [Suillus hirtellus]